MNQIFNRLMNMISLLGVAMLMVPFSFVLLGDRFPASGEVLPTMAILSTFFGYGAQWVFSSLVGKLASDDRFAAAKDGVFDRFRIQHALVPILVILAVSVVSGMVFHSYMDFLCANHVIRYTSAFFGFLAGLLVFISGMGGCVIWFYPIERLSNIFVLITGCVLFVAEAFYLVLTCLAADIGLALIYRLAVPLLVFSFCVFLIYNQSNLQKRYRGSVVTVITPTARAYNMLLVTVLILMMIAVCAVIYVALSGVTIILRALLFILAYKLFSNAANESDYKVYEYVDPDDVSVQFERSVMSPDNQFLLAAFFLMALTAVLLIVGIRTGWLQKILARIRVWLREFFETIFLGSEIFARSSDPNAEDGQYNYKDEKKLLNKDAAVRDYEEMAQGTDSYKSFLQRLGKLETYDEQLCYAYSVLLKIYKNRNVTLKRSDTPREIEEKVIRAISETEIRAITADFERIRYGEAVLGEGESGRVLSGICGVIKRHMF